ncbi:MAG: DMT family transporter [Bacteroidetes bacterium]|nr:MAG: DMT family transporter [Bacteroidota bacterium]
MTNRNKGILYALSAALMWGFLAISLKVTLNHVPPLTIVWMRFTVAFLVLWAVLFLKERSALQVLKKPPPLAILAAVALTFNYIGYIKGLDLTSPSNAQVIIQLAPLLLVVVGLIIYKEKVSAHQIMGFLIALLGFGVFYQDQIGQLLGSPDNYNAGVTWVVGAALAWVLFASLQKGLVQKFHAQGLNLLIYLIPVVLLIPWVDFEVVVSLSLPLWALMIFLGLNTLLAYGAIAEAFRFLPANKVGIIVTINPIITIVTMGLLTSIGVSWIEPQRISLYGFLGAILILAGVITAIILQRKPSPGNLVTRRWRLGLKR